MRTVPDDAASVGLVVRRGPCVKVVRVPQSVCAGAASGEVCERKEYSSMQARVSKAFTLVEILIVVVILGILAAIVIPQFTNASQDAQRGNVVTQLQSIRNQIELYRVRNNGTSPTMAGAVDASFTQMVTPPAGQQPYLRTRPTNPRNGSNGVATSTATGAAFVTAAQAAPAAGEGWLYNAATGEFAAQGFNESTGGWSF